MVQYCKTCEVSRNEGTECDCGHWAVYQGEIEEGKQAKRIWADATYRAMYQFVASGQWDGVSEIAVVSLRIIDDPRFLRYRPGVIYHPDDIWGVVHRYYAPSSECYLLVAQELFNDPEGKLPYTWPTCHFRLDVNDGLKGMVIV